jgi:ubiquinone/menaquinone biosynthesis C-methylase UbiE
MNSELPQIKGGIPQYYDLGLGPNIFEDLGRDLANCVAALNPKNVLELACGTGIVTRLLRDALDNTCQLTATDIIEPMLNVAREKFDDSGQVKLQVADAQELPFQDKSFDTLICQFGIMFFADKNTAYREAWRVLAPGGRYIFNVWNSFEYNIFARITHETAASFFQDDPPAFYHTPFSYYDVENITQSLKSAGFEDVSSDDQRFKKVIGDYDRFAQGLVFGNPLVNEIRSRGSVEPEDVCSAIAKALREEFGTEPSSMPLQAIVVSGTRPS